MNKNEIKEILCQQLQLLKEDAKKGDRIMMKKISKIITVMMVTTILTGIAGCASLKRELKTATSDLSGGLHREVIVYDAVGNELFRQTGKFDVDYEAERILYDDESGDRHVIYFKTGTVIVNEIN